MGFTALDGLPMGTRCGALDPGVVLHLIRAYGMDADAIERMLYHECGLKGVSGISNDMRTLLASDDPRARHAIDLFVWRIARELGALAAVQGGLDGPRVHGRHRRALGRDPRAVCERAAWLGIELDEAANRAGRAAHLGRWQPGRSVCHPDRRGADDRPAHVRRAGPGANRRSRLMPPTTRHQTRGVRCQPPPARRQEGASDRHRQRELHRLGLRPERSARSAPSSPSLI